MTDLRELRRLEPVFWRAPSAHNTQPWLLEYAPDRIALSFDPARALPASDPTRRDLFLGLGAFVEAVLIAAAAEGIALRYERRAFAAADGVYETTFTPQDLEHRRTSRVPYAGVPVEPEVLADARSQLRAGETLHELREGDVADLLAAADRHLYATRPVVDELRAWLRLDPREQRYHEDGLNAECLALSRVEARVLALALRPRVLPLARPLLRASSRRVLRGGASVLVLTGPARDDDDVLESGRSLLRTWLALDRRRHRTHPLSQILDCDETAAELARRLGTRDRPLAVFRAGVSPTPARSPRIVEERDAGAGSS